MNSRTHLSATETRLLRKLLLVQAIDPGAVGVRINLARKEAGMTQDELAALVGVTQRTVQHWESGDHVPYRKLHQLAEALNREPGWFLHGDEQTPTAGALAEAFQEMDESVSERLARLEGTVETLTALLRELVARAERGNPGPSLHQKASTADRPIS